MNARLAALAPALLCSWSLFVSAAGCHVASSSGWDLSDLGFRERETRAESHALEIRTGERLRVDAGYGRIEILAEDGEPSVAASFSARAKTVEMAHEMLAKTSLRVTRDSDGARILVTDEPVDQGEGDVRVVVRTEVELRIRVPAGTRLEVANQSGELRVRGAAGATRLESSYGAIRAAGITGDLRAQTGSGAVEIEDVAGASIEARSSYGDVRLTRSQAAEVEVESASGGVRIEALKASRLHARTRYGNVEIVGSEGEIVASASSGNVVIEDCARVELRASSGYGDVRLRRVQGALEASASSGDVELSEVSGTCAVRAGYGSIALDGTFTEVEAQTRSGSIGVRVRPGSRFEAAWRLESGYGDLLLEVAPGLGFDLDATTTYGEVAVDLPLEREADATSRSLRGKVRGGGPLVRLATQSGDVRVRALAP